MRVIFLNCFSGQLRKPLLDFLNETSSSTDIFCFQEVSVALKNNISNILDGFTNIFEIGGVITDCNEPCGQAIYLSKGIELLESDKVLLHRLITNDVGFLLKARIKVKNKILLIGNVHGTSFPGTKYDTKERLDQSKIILDSFKNINYPKIIGGDFNLLRNTLSIKMFDGVGDVNLIAKYNITSTRNKVAWERFKDQPEFVKQYDSDYCFVSPDVEVKNFSVPNVEVSDHEPLILDFEV